MFRKLVTLCIAVCALVGCGPSYHWSKSHPLYKQPPYSSLSISGTQSTFVLTRSKWFAKKLEIAPESVQVQVTSFCERVFLDEMKRAYPALKEIPDATLNAFPEESQKLDDRIFIKGHFPEQGIAVKDADGSTPALVLIIHEFIIGTDQKRELYYDYDLIHKESEEKPTSKNLSAIFSYTLWDNERQRPLFSAVEEIQQSIVKLTMDDMKSLIATAARKVRVSLYEGARQ